MSHRRRPMTRAEVDAYRLRNREIQKTIAELYRHLGQHFALDHRAMKKTWKAIEVLDVVDIDLFNQIPVKS